MRTLKAELYFFFGRHQCATLCARHRLASISVACFLLIAFRALAAPVNETNVASEVTALAVTTPGPASHIRGSDGKEHIAYDLLITNAFTTDVALRAIEVLGKRDPRGDWKSLLTLEGQALADATHELQRSTPTARVPRSVTVVTLIDISIPEAELPKRLSHRIAYEVPHDAPSLNTIGSRQVNGPELGLKDPVTIRAPLDGGDWFGINACCAPSGHRELLSPANGHFVTPEMFAIDWLRLRNGRLHDGDGSQLSQWYGEDSALLAIADGEVVRAVDGRPEVAPAPFGTPVITKPDEFNGNYVVLRIGPGVYAFYAHVKTGTISVQVGQRVRAGQILGHLGMSGQTTAPHLHFSLQDGPDPQTSNSLPFQLDRFKMIGTGTLIPLGIGDGIKPDVPISRSAAQVRRAYPLTNTIADFGTGTDDKRL